MNVTTDIRTFPTSGNSYPRFVQVGQAIADGVKSKRAVKLTSRLWIEADRWNQIAKLNSHDFATAFAAAKDEAMSKRRAGQAACGQIMNQLAKIDLQIEADEREIQVAELLVKKLVD